MWEWCRQRIVLPQDDVQTSCKRRAHHSPGKNNLGNWQQKAVQDFAKNESLIVLNDWSTCRGTEMIRFPALGRISAPPPFQFEKQMICSKMRRHHLVQVFQALEYDPFQGTPKEWKILWKVYHANFIYCTTIWIKQVLILLFIAQPHALRNTSSTSPAL